MTDRHACDFAAVNITVTKIRMNKASPFAGATDPGWVDIPVSPARKINVANLTNGVLDILGQGTLEVGHYRQLMLVLDTNSMANTFVPSAGDAEQALELPQGVDNSIPVFADVDVAEGQKTDVVVDMQACGLVGTTADGKHVLNLGSRATVPPAPNGITGAVSPAALANHVLVTAQLHTDGLQPVPNVASTRPDPVTGEFWLSHLTAGNYDIVLTADNSAVSVIGHVPVADAAATPVSTGASPIQMVPSKMGSISGVVTFIYFGSGGLVSALQQFAPDVYGTIQYTAIDLGTGAYTLSNLPLAAPQYAAYTSSLPLAFSASGTATPGNYTVMASSPGMLPKGVIGVDISTGDKTGVNLSLVPSGP
jgi:hypothetical protein